MRYRLFILTILILAGCSALSSAHSKRSATRPTTQPATLRHADAVAVDKFFQPADSSGENLELTLTDKISTGDKSTLYFGQLDTFHQNKSDLDNKQITATSPVIIWRDAKGDHGLIVGDDRLEDAAWTYVAAGPAHAELWAILDASLDDPQKDLILIHSTDSGETWTVSSITKADRDSAFDSFCMSRNGKGRVTLYASPSAKGKRNKSSGYDTFRTDDGGKTWLAPTHEPDGMQPADSVDPDSDEQIDPPTPLQKAMLEGRMHMAEVRS